MRISPSLSQRLVVTALWLVTAATIGTLLLLIAYILTNGLPHVTWKFLTQVPRDMGRKGGIFPMIVGTAEVTGLAVFIAAPIGVATAVFLTEYTREGKLTAAIRFGADCLAGIPSIIFGLFGYVFFVVTLKMGYSVLAGALTLTLMVLPTIIRTSEEAIRAVPGSFRDVSYGMGSTRWQMVTRVVLRCALPGIGTGIVLSIGRCVSETAALLLTAGAAAPTIAVYFYILATEGGVEARPNAFAAAAVLVVSILAINLLAYWAMRRFVAKAR